MLRSFALVCLSVLVLVPAHASAAVIWYYGPTAASEYTAHYASPVTDFAIPYSIEVSGPAGTVVTFWNFQRSVRRDGPVTATSLDLNGTEWDSLWSLRSVGSGTYLFSDLVTTWPVGDALPPGVYSPGLTVPTLTWSYGTSWPEDELDLHSTLLSNSFSIRVLEEQGPSIPEPGTSALLVVGLLLLVRRRRD